MKQPGLGSLSSFSGKYRFLNLNLQALVKEPALSDGRLQPGDKLLAANGVELASFSHQEVIILMVLLMGCTQIPISTLSHIWVFVRLYGIVFVIIVIIIIIIMIIKSEGVNAQL